MFPQIPPTNEPDNNEPDNNDLKHTNDNTTDNNSGYESVKAKKRNKNAHITNGNIEYRDFSIVQINSGNGKWCLNDQILKASIEKHEPDVLVISESNINITDNKMTNNRRSRFSNYICFDKVFIGSSNARLSVLVNKNLEVQRHNNIENDINPTIVLTVNTSAKKHHTLVANYRQWKGTAPNYNYNLRTDDHAIERLKEMTKVWESAIQLGNPTTIVGDINIDRYEPNDPESRPDLKNLIPILRDFQIQNKLILVNKEPTRYRHGQRPTLLDLILTTQPQNISEIANISNFCSEHMGVYCKIKLNQIVINQQFRKVRSRKNLIASVLMPLIDENENLQKIFSTSDPEIIASTLTKEIDDIIEYVAPSKLIQIKKTDKLRITKETKDKIKEADKAVTNATKTLAQDDFRKAKNLQNDVKKAIKKDETDYLKKNLNNNRTDFRTINEELNDENKTPTRIIHEGEEIRSQKKLATTFNKFYKTKIDNIRKKFDDETENAINILKATKDKPDDTFKFKPITVYKVHEIIQKAKTSNSAGKDNLTMNIIKQCHQFFSRALCHLFNSMIYTRKFPDSLKCSKLIPILKPSKNPMSCDSYRPIAILQASEKIIEQMMRMQMQQYFSDNKIIPEQHHGGLKNHSTITAMASLDHSHKILKEKHKHTLIMTTDLSAAFDTVDHTILLKKLKFYGISNSASDLLESFLFNRRTFVEIQGYRSEEIQSSPCSVIQGSILSGFLYTLYSIEIPLIPNILKNQQLTETLMEMRIPRYYSVDHEINQFVDDSSSIIAAETEEEIGNYTSDFLAVMDKYYHFNKLKLNPEKTKLMITKTQDITKIKIKTPTGENLQEDKAIKILGIWKNKRDAYDTHIAKIKGIVIKKLSELYPYLHCMTLKTRRKIVYSKISSIVLYGIELFMGQSERIIEKVTALLMRCNRAIYLKDFFKVSNMRICKDISVDPPDVLIKKSGLKFIHKLIQNEAPAQLFSKIRINNRMRKCSKISLRDGIRKECNKRNLIYQSVQLYNNLSTDLKYLPIKKFKRQLQKVKNV